MQVCFELSDTQLATCDEGLCQPIVSQLYIIFFIKMVLYIMEKMELKWCIFLLLTLVWHLYLWMCLSMSEWDKIPQFWLWSWITLHLIIWLSWNLVHLTTLRCISWCWCCSSCQQLIFTLRTPKVCLAKCSGNFLDMNFEYCIFSVAQKLTKLQNFLLRLPKYLS